MKSDLSNNMLSNQFNDISQQLPGHNPFYAFEQSNLIIPNPLHSNPHSSHHHIHHHHHHHEHQHYGMDQSTDQLHNSNNDNIIPNEISTNTIPHGDYALTQQQKNELYSSIFSESNYFLSNTTVNTLSNVQYSNSKCIQQHIPESYQSVIWLNQEHSQIQLQEHLHYTSNGIITTHNHNHNYPLIINNENNENMNKNCNELSNIKVNNTEMDSVLPVPIETVSTTMTDGKNIHVQDNDNDVIMMRPLVEQSNHFETSEHLSGNTVISNDLIDNIYCNNNNNETTVTAANNNNHHHYDTNIIPLQIYPTIFQPNYSPATSSSLSSSSSSCSSSSFSSLSSLSSSMVLCTETLTITPATAKSSLVTTTTTNISPSSSYYTNQDYKLTGLNFHQQHLKSNNHTDCNNTLVTNNVNSNNNNNNSNNHSNEKKCKVCGDRAVNHNFGQLTCESCKAFFRRNAHKVS
ncbi:uncharacterized protein DC041_0009485 [Schistosoma bovis]|uniref:Nuclear receptor domain-containing protein n=1 Tax=Schistosoma bovis TaxID=6184 RepID=A0A430Q9V9_SCHBO|nr:uncharacterized protein DC041_0009485 [Schistosoma bovis]